MCVDSAHIDYFVICPSFFGWLPVLRTSRHFPFAFCYCPFAMRLLLRVLERSALPADNLTVLPRSFFPGVIVCTFVVLDGSAFHVVTSIVWFVTFRFDAVLPSSCGSQPFPTTHVLRTFRSFVSFVCTRVTSFFFEASRHRPLTARVPLRRAS
ncbi:hypothetical protein R1flu_012865 [Riccia fluitans]|uniref:Uncharacterized protein n=1 Tax=Riccia fluitans TaxID=41844 RepID=A0ABD1ZC31_9MARC